MSEAKAIVSRLAKRVEEKDEASIRRLAKAYYNQADARILPANLELAAGTCFAKSGEYNTSASFYKRFLRFYREHAMADEVRYRIGVLYARYLKMPEEATRYLTLVAQSDSPRAEAARNQLGKIKKEKRALKGALVDKPAKAAKAAARPPAEAGAGPFVVLLPEDAKVNVSAVGREVAEALGMSLVDVTRRIKATRLLLAEDVSADEARAIKAAVMPLGVAPVIAPVSGFAAIPAPETVTRAQFIASAFELQTANDMVTGDYAMIRLIASAQMRPGKRKLSGRGFDADVEGLATDRERRHAQESTVKEWRVIDVFLRKPPRRLRLDERTIAITEQSDVAMNRRINLKMLGEKLARFAGSAPAGRSLGAFGVKGPSGAHWDDFTYETDEAYDLHCRCLLALTSSS